MVYLFLPLLVVGSIHSVKKHTRHVVAGPAQLNVQTCKDCLHRVRREPGMQEKSNDIDLSDDYDTYIRKKWKKDEEEYIKERDKKKPKPDHVLYMLNAWDRLKQTVSTDKANTGDSRKRLKLLLKEMEDYWKREEAKGNTARIKEREKKEKIFADLKEWDEEFKRKWKADEEAYEREINKPTPHHVLHMIKTWDKLKKTVTTDSNVETIDSTERLKLLGEEMERYWKKQEAKGNTVRIKEREEKAKLFEELEEWDEEFRRKWKKDEEKYERERNKTKKPEYGKYMSEQWKLLKDSGSTNRLETLSKMMNTYWQEQELMGITEKVQEKMDHWTMLYKMKDHDIEFKKQWKMDEEAYEREKNKKKPDHIKYMFDAWKKVKEKINITIGSDSTKGLKALGEEMRKYWEQQEKSGNTYRIQKEREMKEAWRKKGEETMKELRIQNDPVKMEERRREKERVEEEKKKKKGRNERNT
uniref:Uncharacterized protein n=1 Tax=Cacopsylla melanoneura TaxID=428564 RepID=A0A8D8S959_9HEMI